MFLDAAKHERLEDHMQSPKLFRLERPASSTRGVLDILREPLAELLVRVKQARHDEVKQCPEF